MRALSKSFFPALSIEVRSTILLYNLRWRMMALREVAHALINARLAGTARRGERHYQPSGRGRV